MDNVALAGFWTVVEGRNLSACTFRRVIAGTDARNSGRSDTNAFVLRADQGSFQNYFIDCQLHGFNYAFEYRLFEPGHASTESSYEGQYFRGVHATNCNGFLWVKNESTTDGGTLRQPPHWHITDCEWECRGNWFDISAVSDLWIQGCYAQGYPMSDEESFIALKYVVNAWILNNSFNFFNRRARSVINLTHECKYVRMIGNLVHPYTVHAVPHLAGVYIETDRSAGEPTIWEDNIFPTYREQGRDVDLWRREGVPKVADVNGRGRTLSRALGTWPG
jgi:hypothetical protein